MSVSYGGDSITFADNSTISSGWTGFKNRVINGAMRIDQRNSGASINVAGNAASVGFPVDRTFIYNNTGTANTSVTGQQVSVSDATCPFDYAVRATIGNMTSRNTYDGRFQHNIEGNNVADYVMGTTTMVVSFWARASKSGYAYYTIWSSNAGTGNYLYKRISLTTSWQKFTINIPACNLSGAAILKNTGRAFGTGLYWAQTGWTEANDGLWVIAAQLGNTNRDDFTTNGDWIEFTGYQLEFGSAASSFEYRSHTTELQLCQRYFEYGFTRSLTSTSFSGSYNPDHNWFTQFKVEKRSSPTVTRANVTDTQITFNGITPNIYGFTSEYDATTNGQNSSQFNFLANSEL